jgi:serralysin
VNALNGALTQTVKYAFATTDSLKSLSGADARGAAVMTDVQKTAVADAFAYLSNVINLRFEAVSDPAQADIVFGQNHQAGVSAGYANAPNQSGGHAEYLFLASDQSTNSTFTNGSYGLTTLLHEIGHTLGLKHPGNYNAGGGGTVGPYLPAATDNRRFSLMSYNAAPGTSANPQTLMGYDVLALQFLYGANTNPAAPSALARHQTTTFTDSWNGLETLWAPNGAALDASQTTKKDIFDLREGAFSSIAVTGSAANNNMGLAYGSKITRATGGSGADTFYTAATGDVTMDGGAGADTLFLAGKASECSKSADVYTRQLAGKAVARVTAQNIETIAYYDSAKAALMHV